jgi:hypothetical protein
MDMKNLVILILGVITILTSCGVTKNILDNTSDVKSNEVEVMIVLPGEVDNSPQIIDTVNLYSTYLVNYKNGQSQRLSYEYRTKFSLYDSLNVTHIDTLQYKVPWSELY